MKVIFLGYREWALNAFAEIKHHSKIKKYKICMSDEELLLNDLNDYDLLITLGWSDELGEDITSKIKAFGLHCAELDRYSYGTPIQNQIIDGIKVTKHRIFPFIWDPKSKRAHTHTREFSHEVDLSLEGSMEDIFQELSKTSIILLSKFLNDFPNIKYIKWDEETEISKARIPSDSKLSLETFNKMNTEELYNFIRCLEDPYPNAFIEDEVGTISFKKVAFKKK